jgi:hypothetical protein
MRTPGGPKRPRLAFSDWSIDRVRGFKPILSAALAGRLHRYSLGQARAGMHARRKGVTMSTSVIQAFASRPWRPFGVSGVKAFRLFPGIVLLLCASLLVALETPSKPFLEKNSFYLSSAGFRVQLANDPAGQKAMRALPAHRFVMHNVGGVVHYLYAEPNHCACIFVGTQANYQNYRDILARPLEQADNVAPDYKTQASALLYGDPYDFYSLNPPDSLADYLQTYY